MLRVVAVFSVLWLACPASFLFLEATTEVLGVGSGITQNAAVFSPTTIISQLTPTFDAFGLTSITICYKSLIPRGDGAVYSSDPQDCTIYGTPSGSNTTEKFIADEWPTNIQPCVSTDGVIVGLNVSTNCNYYWIAGNFANCTIQNFTFPDADGATIAIYGISTGDRPSTLPPGIGGLQLSYFYCTLGATDCPAALYNGGGPCGVRNGGCDLGVNCMNQPAGFATCGPCQTGFAPDAMQVCRPILGGHTYSVSGATFPFNEHPNGAAYNATSPLMPPYKVSAFNAQFEKVNDTTVMTRFGLTFQQVSLGRYVAGTTVTRSAAGEGANLFTGEFLENQTLSFPENEWIVNFSTRIVSWSGAYQGVASINLTTNLRAFTLNPGNTGPLFDFQSQNLNGQIIVAFKGSRGELLDNVNFIGASCTGNCPADPYGSGLCATKPSNLCSGGFCQDTSDSFQCTCYSGYVQQSETLCLPSFDYCGSGFCADGVSCSLNAGPLGYECGVCASGFTGSGYTQCQDINECLTPGICGLQLCNNTDGSFECESECVGGYTYDVTNGCVDINECDLNDCGDNRDCTNTPGSFTCGDCFSGYQLISDACVDINECTLGECGTNRDCTNTPGSFTCGDCFSGYQLISDACVDINECELNECGNNRNCTNTPGSFTCGDCFSGYQLINDTCVDIDECDLNECGNNRNCTNTPGSFSCGDCFSGYQLINNTCIDINECGLNECGTNRNCTNTPGSFSCGDCFPGYQLSRDVCVDINECDLHKCGDNRNCTNTQGSFTCGNCFGGFQLKNDSCVDIDECALLKCGANRNCTNTQGTYSCGSCFPGFQLINGSCVDIDECSQNKCGTNRNCTNTQGSFTCGNCFTGYQLTNDSCVDIDECSMNKCGSNRNCTNTQGSFTCGNCFKGYQLTNDTCQDINECDLNECGDNRNCTNTQGGFSCENCFQGYQLINDTCQDINECNLNKCGDNRNCTNTQGSFTCGNCFSGYQLINDSCTDINECDLGKCGANRSCTNTQGSFTCGNCFSGYLLVNNTCEDIEECTLGECGPIRNCTNTQGSFICGSCFSGYSLTNDTCVDIDECASNACGINQICNNTIGSFTCGDCFPGYESVNLTCVDFDECSIHACGNYRFCNNTQGSYVCGDCFSGFQSQNGSCVDIDECANNICGNNRLCNNTLGNYTCGDCYQGYQFLNDSCVDINECLTNACGENRFCNNTLGNFSCGDCFSGYQLLSNICEDIDECSVNSSICGTRECINTIGNYTCGNCIPGYEIVDGICEVFNVCRSVVCHPDAHCVPTTNSYTCLCNPGFAGDGAFSCVDVDECATNGGGCSIYATCINTPGSYECMCHDFYYGNGSYCALQCGDGLCNETYENCLTCPMDCKQTFCHVCGDGYCERTANETCTSCPNDCGECEPKACGKPPCNNRGTCYNGYCTCNAPWTGTLCEARTQPISVKIGNTVSIMFNQVQFQVAITRIIEYDLNMNNVYEINLDPNLFNFSLQKASYSSNNVQWNFGTQFQNRAIFNVTIWQFEDEPYSYHSFAQTPRTFPPHTLKFTFQISSWPFKNSTNSLGIETLSANPSSSSSSSVSTRADRDQSLSVRSVSITEKSNSLYAQFYSLALVDGRQRNITYSASNNNLNITAIIPHFWYSAVVDPDYSVLIEPKAKNKISTTVIIAVAVPLVLVVLVSLLVKFWPKIATRRTIVRFSHKIDAYNQETELEALKNRRRGSTVSRM